MLPDFDSPYCFEPVKKRFSPKFGALLRRRAERLHELSVSALRELHHRARVDSGFLAAETTFLIPDACALRFKDDEID